MAVGLTPIDVVTLWERGRDAEPLARAFALWQAATGLPDDEVAGLPVGRADAALVRSRIATFGPRAASFVACPECGEELEFDLDLSAMLLDPAEPGQTAHERTAHVLDHDGWRVEFRLPSAADLRAVAAEGGGSRGLLARCILAASRSGLAQPTTRATADDALVAALDTRMRELDPQADLELRLSCAACQYAWPARFDIAQFFWREIEVEAGRVLAEVHQLARAYSWSEADILALTPARRRAYLALVGAG